MPTPDEFEEKEFHLDLGSLNVSSDVKSRIAIKAGLKVVEELALTDTLGDQVVLGRLDPGRWGGKLKLLKKLAP